MAKKKAVRKKAKRKPREVGGVVLVAPQINQRLWLTPDEADIFNRTQRLTERMVVLWGIPQDAVLDVLEQQITQQELAQDAEKARAKRVVKKKAAPKVIRDRVAKNIPILKPKGSLRRFILETLMENNHLTQDEVYKEVVRNGWESKALNPRAVFLQCFKKLNSDNFIAKDGDLWTINKLVKRRYKRE